MPLLDPVTTTTVRDGTSGTSIDLTRPITLDRLTAFLTTLQRPPGENPFGGLPMEILERWLGDAFERGVIFIGLLSERLPRWLGEMAGGLLSTEYEKLLRPVGLPIEMLERWLGEAPGGLPLEMLERWLGETFKRGRMFIGLLAETLPRVDETLRRCAPFPVTLFRGPSTGGASDIPP